MSALDVSQLRVSYGAQEVVHGIDLHVEAGEVVALLGPNGAGKTSTLLAIVGATAGASGVIRLGGEAANGRLWQRARQGVAYLPETRAIVRALTVSDNLRLAGCDRQKALALSPELGALQDRQAGLLSGGEQQILSLTMALALRPSLVCADELSFGLAPIVVNRMLALVQDAARAGAAVLIVEQFARKALTIADRAYVMSRGELVLEGPGSELLTRIDELEAAYFGTPSVGLSGTSE